MTMTATKPIVVGYSATATGQDALRLGIALAKDQERVLHLVLVSPEDSPYNASLPYDRSYDTILGEQLDQWLKDAAAEVPSDITVKTTVYPAPSAPEGLLSAAREIGAGLIVIGSRAGGLLRRHRVGTMGTHLLSASDIPVALAPTGYRHAGPLGRLTTMFGRRPGLTDLIGESIATARQRNIPFRLVSLATPDIPSADVTEEVLAELESSATERLAKDAAELVAAGNATAQIAGGRNVAEAMSLLDWADDEAVVVGSSPLATRGRLSLGSTARKMLRVAPVPVVVIPAGYTAETI